MPACIRWLHYRRLSQSLFLLLSPFLLPSPLPSPLPATYIAATAASRRVDRSSGCGRSNWSWWNPWTRQCCSALCRPVSRRRTGRGSRRKILVVVCCTLSIRCASIKHTPCAAPASLQMQNSCGQPMLPLLLLFLLLLLLLLWCSNKLPPSSLAATPTLQMATASVAFCVCVCVCVRHQLFQLTLDNGDE